MILPRRVFNSPCIQYANFEDGTHINLIRLIKPYKNGASYAIHNTTKSKYCTNGLYKTLERAHAKFEVMVMVASNESPLRNQGECPHNYAPMGLSKANELPDMEFRQMHRQYFLAKHLAGEE